MQVFAVAISGVLLGARKGFLSQIIYLLMGSIGLPVFANISGGLSIVLGPTGGFILVDFIKIGLATAIGTTLSKRLKNIC